MASFGSKGIVAACCTILLLACAVAYHNSLTVPFLFDDEPAVVENGTIRQLWPPWTALSPPPAAAGAGGRPLVNFSLALNYAWGGLEPRSYHVVNIALHALCALLLFGVVRRTLVLPRLRLQAGASATLLGGLIALLWAVHPLLTESVTCVVQRSEILGGLFYLLTLYCFVRSTDTPAPGRWERSAVAACILGVASKELVASVPVMVLLYDRALVAGTFAEAWRRRRAMYLGFSASWILLGFLIVDAEQRARSVGFGLGVSPWHYLLTQCEAIVIYLRLSFWPDPLVMDYGTDLVQVWTDVWPQGVFLCLLALATVWALWRRPVAGFVGFWFFGILAPSSSIVPLTTQTIAEHRMYLPLAAVIVTVVLALHRLVRRPVIIAALGGVVVIALVFLTIRRNHDYQTSIGIWKDNVTKRPGNARAHCNLANELSKKGDRTAAITSYETALRLEPDYPEAHNNLGTALVLAGRRDEAIAHFRASIQVRPDGANTRFNLGLQLFVGGQVDEAEEQFRLACELEPASAKFTYFWAQALHGIGRAAEAEVALARSRQLDPEFERSLKSAITGPRRGASDH